MNISLLISLWFLVIMNIFLWIWILLNRMFLQREKIISIIANAIKYGDANICVYYGPHYLTLYNKDLQLLYDYLKLNIIKTNAQPEKYVVVKKDKKE